MIDLRATLLPDAGLVRSWVVLEPGANPLWTVALDVGIADARASSRGESESHLPRFDRVGACGWTRLDTLTRAAGEAVERFALIAQPDDPLAVARVPPEDPRRVAVGLAAHGRVASALDATSLDCVTVTEPGANHGELLLPLAAVDDPPDRSLRQLVDASPSGVAAGPDWEFAASRALIEEIERDAAVTAWVARPSVQVVDPTRVVTGKGRHDGRHVAELRAYLDAEGLEARSLLLPTDVPGIRCALTGIARPGDAHPFFAAGVSAQASAVAAVHASAREAVQVLFALRATATPTMSERAGPVTGDGARAVYCTTDVPSRWWASWLERCSPGTVSELDDAASTPEAAMVAALLRDQGHRPLMVDLSPRLPPPIRAQGWRVARAVVLGLQPLRMQEEHAWSWRPNRIERWGGGEAGSLIAAAPPHPLI